MSEALLEPAELRSRGFDALVDALGWVNAVRFIQQYETSRLDYTVERTGILATVEPEDMLRRVREISSGMPSPRPD